MFLNIYTQEIHGGTKHFPDTLPCNASENILGVAFPSLYSDK